MDEENHAILDAGRDPREIHADLLFKVGGHIEGHLVDGIVNKDVCVCPDCWEELLVQLAQHGGCCPDSSNSNQKQPHVRVLGVAVFILLRPAPSTPATMHGRPLRLCDPEPHITDPEPHITNPAPAHQ